MQTVSRPPTSASSPSCERGASYEYTRLLKHCDNSCMVANHSCYHSHYKRNDNRVAGSSRSLGLAHIGSIVVPFSGVPYRIRIMNPKKELLWGLWVGETLKFWEFLCCLAELVEHMQKWPGAFNHAALKRPCNNCAQ